ncbi:hypothetical protein D4R52_03590 [bacterium]|nr:MAG: hypothetical protein D4R52_03590 [bacterium]
MTKLDQTKFEAINLLKNLCARCKNNEEHSCPVRRVAQEIKKIDGIPVIVNDRLCHVVFTPS